MKTIITIIISLTSLTILGQNQAIPKAVNQAFSETYTGANDVKWKKAAETYEVGFIYEGEVHTVVYDKYANIIALKTAIDRDQIPESINLTIRQEHRNDVIDEVELVKTDGQIYYYVTFDNNEEPVAYSFEGEEDVK